ncbi:MAG: T9SS type A sorting domain-containing protein [Candidatus Aegiribacteria sp.]|nr:T9SS type A sorting domain-containing protein [Candidatus Aegiribacteria sp.]
MKSARIFHGAMTIAVLMTLSGIAWSIDISDGYYYPTESRGHNPQVITASNFGPQIYYYSGTHNRTYFLWMQRGGTGYSIENMVLYYDHDTEELSESYGVGPGTPGATDCHAHGAVIVADDGHIIVIHEKLWNTGGSGHNSEYQIKRSVNPEDPSAGFTLVHQTGSGNCYPKIWKTANGDLFVSSRYGSDSYYNHYRIMLFKSTDNGLTWDAGNIVVNFGTARNYWAYHGRITQSDTDGIHLAVNRCDRDPGYGYPDCYYLNSEDGENWTNIDGSFTKNIITDGPLTCDEMDSHCLVQHLPGNNEITSLGSGCFSPSGDIYFTNGETWRNSPDPCDWYLRYWEDNEWKKVVIPHNGEFMWIYGLHCITDEEFDIYIEYYGTAKREIQRWKTTNRGQTWNVVEEITSGSDYDHRYPVITSNLDDSPYLSLASSYLNASSCADFYIMSREKPTTSLEEQSTSGMLTDVILNQNSPNPISLHTAISYTLSETGSVSLAVYDISGKLVETLVDGEIQQEGNHSVLWDTGEMHSGIYFYRITTGNTTETRMCTVLR